MNKLLAAVAAVCLLAAASLQMGCSRSAEANVAPPADAPTIAVVKATSESLTRNIVVTAEFKPYQEVDVMAKVAGYVSEIKVDVGDRVREGELLATLEIPEMADDLRRSQAGVKHSQAEVERARDEISRAKLAHEIAHLSYTRLAAVAQKKPGLIAQQEIDDAQAKDTISETQVSAANSALSAAQQQVDVEQSSTQRVQTLMRYQQVTAPFAGVVTRRFADKGSMIQAGTASQTQAMPLVRISQNALLRLILPVPESAVPTVHIGQQVQVRVPTLNRTFAGKVARFDQKLSTQTRTMDTEVDVPNPDMVLMPGMYAEVDLTLQRKDNAIAIPIMAVDSATESNGQVMVVTPNHRVELRKIALGVETSNMVEARSGLNEGDMVVLSGRSALQSGQEVQPKLTAMTAAAK